MKKHQSGNLMNEYLDDRMGKKAPNMEVTRITNTDEILAPMCSPLKSLSVEHVVSLGNNIVLMKGRLREIGRC